MSIDNEPPHPADAPNVVDFEKRAATAKKHKRKKKVAQDDEPPPLTADEITNIVEEEVFDENGLAWELDPVTGIYRTGRSQQDGRLTIANATEKLAYKRHGRPPYLSTEQIRGALTDIVSDHRADLWLSMKVRHGQEAPPAALRKPNTTALQQFLMVLADPAVLSDDLAFEHKVVEHRQFIWNTKQRLMGRDDKNHLILDWHGVGGSGKSTLARRMIDVIYGPLAGSITLNAYDPLGFNKDVLWQLLIGLADEANGEDSVSTANLKNGITSRTVLGRNMYSQQSPSSDRNMSLIICRNGMGIWEKLAGDRRVASLLCDPTPASDNENALNHALSLVPDMWDSVYYDEPEPLKPYVSALRKERELTTVNESFVALWLANCCTKAQKTDGAPYLKVKHSMRRYRGTGREKIPANKEDMKSALEAAGAEMTSTHNVYTLTSHAINADWQ